MGALQAQSVLQRQGEGENPKRRRALVDGPIDSRFAALTIMQPNAARQLGMRIWTTVSSPVTAFTKQTSCTDNFSARLHMDFFLFMSAKWATSASMGGLRCLNGGEMRMASQRVFMM